MTVVKIRQLTQQHQARWSFLILFLILVGLAILATQCQKISPSDLKPSSKNNLACSSNGYSAVYYPFEGSPYQSITLDDASFGKFLEQVRNSGNQTLIDIQQLTCLEDLWIPSAQWTHINGQPTYIYSVTSLKPLAKLTHLKSLMLEGINTSDFTPLSALTKLTELRIFDSPITDLSPLSPLINLRWLNINPRRDRGWTQKKVVLDLAPLATLTNLEWLAITSDAPIDLTPLYNLKHLQNLTIDGDWAGLDVGSQWFAPTKKTSYPTEIINLKKALPQLKVNFGEGGLVQNLPTNFIQ